MISSQAETVFHLANEEYDKLQKVYSIWICSQAPEKYAGTIDTYEMCPKRMIGGYNGPERYDLLEVVMVRLGKEIHHENELLEVLGILFSDHLSAFRKMNDLEKIGVDARNDKNLQEGVNRMCNLSDGIEERAVERTTKQVTEQVTKQVTRQNSIDTALYLLANLPQMSDEQIREAIQNHLSLEEIRSMRKGEKLS
jgi:hypothetical protein